MAEPLYRSSVLYIGYMGGCTPAHPVLPLHTLGTPGTPRVTPYYLSLLTVRLSGE